VGGLLDTVVPGVTGELVPPRRADALAVVLRDLLDDPDRRTAYGAAGRRRAVQLYDWRQVVARTDAVYEAVVGAHARLTTEVAR
jgi:glycosyltransferase involved in cell wall biosynthesis